MLSNESGMKLQVDTQFTDYGLNAILHHIILNFSDIITELHFIFTLLLFNSERKQCLFLYFVKDL